VGRRAAEIVLLLALALEPLLAPDAGAQALRAHGIGADAFPDRALHVRLALADAAALATVEAVETGRIRVRDARVLFGEAATAFELKRAPSNPPPLEAGDRALLLLRGARSPYLLVDEPEEIAILADADQDPTWRDAVLQLRAARGDPARWAELYRGWLESPAAPLRRAAARGLGDRAAAFQPLDAETVERIVRAATADPDPDVRLTAAIAAGESGAGRRALLAALPGDGSGADLRVLLAAIGAAMLHAEPEATATLVRCLRHPDSAVRGAALRVAGSLAGDPGVRAELERVAVGDPEEELRNAAGRALKRSRGRQD
jgi:hypothetical protein